jgi:hypothetical protein
MITEDNCYPIDILSYLIMFYILSNYYFILCTKRIYQQKSGILVDEYNLFDVALILEVVSLYHDEPEPVAELVLKIGEGRYDFFFKWRAKIV